MSKSNIFSLCVFVVTVVAMLTLGVVPAASQPPDNDNRSMPTIINAIPFSETQSTTEATQGSDDPYVWCDYYSGNPQATVWYSLTPTEALDVQVTTNGSNYNTVLVAFNSWGDQIGCSTSGMPLLLELNATETVSFMIGDQYASGYPGSGGGGTLVFSVDAVLGPENDDFANALIVDSIPYRHTVDITGASSESGEPNSSCDYNNMRKAVWYAFIPDESGSYSIDLRNHNFNAFVAAYTGDSLNNLSEIGCGTSYGGGNLFTIEATAGATYYYQIGRVYQWDSAGPIQFNLDVAPMPVADFDFWPSDPSMFEEVHFAGYYSHDPANVGIESYIWDFGDSGTVNDCCPNHRFSTDGEYTVELTVITFDGRSASTMRLVEVQTHDLAITKFQTPKSAKAGQTRQVSVGIRNQLYPEMATVRLYRSVPGGFEYIGNSTQEIPVRSGNRTTNFDFNYTFTESDAAQGKVTFKAIVDLHSRRDALPADNEAISSPANVNK